MPVRVHKCSSTHVWVHKGARAQHNLECHFSPGTPTLFSRDGVCQWPDVHQQRQVSHPGIKPTSDGAGSVYHSARLLELVYLWCLLLLLCVCVSIHVHVSSVPRYWILLELELQAVVSRPAGLLRVELGSSVK